MIFFTLKYSINHELYTFVVRAESLDQAKKLVDQLDCSSGKEFIKVLDQIQDTSRQMLIAGVASVWN